jgi:hypothetical protein
MSDGNVRSRRRAPAQEERYGNRVVDAMTSMKFWVAEQTSAGWLDLVAFVSAAPVSIADPGSSRDCEKTLLFNQIFPLRIIYRRYYRSVRF